MTSSPLPFGDAAATKPTPLGLMWLFVGLALIGIGGGLPAHARRTLLARGWMTDVEFAESFTLAQLTPGPNAVNLAAMVGVRLSGKLAALLCVLGILTPGLIAMLIAAAVTLGLPGGLPPAVQSALKGAACAALGVMVTAAIPVVRVGLGVRGGWMVAGLTFLAQGVLRLNLVPVLLVALVVGLFIHRPCTEGQLD